MLQNTDIDVLAIGETLVDFISTEPANSLREATTFERYLGGSPANIVVNLSKLGKHAAIMSKVGVGAFGQFLHDELVENGVNTGYMILDPRVNTSFAFVAKTSGTPDFEPSRNSDYKLTPSEVAEEAIERAKIIHASTWAISQDPCRSAVHQAFHLASEQHKIISLDPNYSPVVWADYDEAKQVIEKFYRYVTITKASLDDSHRLFGKGKKPEEYIEILHELGPETVVFTMGKEGSIVSKNGHILGQIPARPVKVVDATGAGDAFWAGFLTALLDEQPLERCLLFAREIVEMKLATVGTLSNAVNRDEIYARLPEADLVSSQ